MFLSSLYHIVYDGSAESFVDVVSREDSLVERCPSMNELLWVAGLNGTLDKPR